MNLVTKLALGLSTIIAIVILAMVALPGQAATIDRTPDCDKYSVMYCGSFTKAEIIKKLEKGDGKNSAKNIQGIFKEFGLTAKRIDGDKLVKGVVYQNGDVKVGSKVVATKSQTYIRTLGGRVSTSKMGSAQEALVHINSKGVFEYAVMTPCGNPVTGKAVQPPKPEPKPKPQPKPESLSCDILKVVSDTKTRKVAATVTGSATNTSISAYSIDFGDGTKVASQTASHTYANYGKFTIKAYVSGKVNGKTTTSGGTGSCVKVVEFKQPPKPLEQSITCDSLNLDLFNSDKKYVKVTVSGTAQNTKIDSYKIDFGDGTTANTATAEHTYADYKEYTIKAYVNGKIKEEMVVVGGEGNCVQTVSFKEDIEPCPTNPSLPIDDPNCKPCPTNPELNYDDPNCDEPEEVVEELPVTGPGAMVGLFSGVSILGAVSHRLWLGRRL